MKTYAKYESYKEYHCGNSLVVEAIIVLIEQLSCTRRQRAYAYTAKNMAVYYSLH